MNDREKLNFIKEEIIGLNYLNSVLIDAVSYHIETGRLNPEFLYLNTVMKTKFLKIIEQL